MQRRLHSLLETCISTAIGFIVSFVSNLVILPLFDLHATMGQTIWMTIFFTVISVVRGYWVRRLFNWLHVKGVL